MGLRRARRRLTPRRGHDASSPGLCRDSGRRFSSSRSANRSAAECHGSPVTLRNSPHATGLEGGRNRPAGSGPHRRCGMIVVAESQVVKRMEARCISTPRILLSTRRSPCFQARPQCNRRGLECKIDGRWLHPGPSAPLRVQSQLTIPAPRRSWWRSRDPDRPSRTRRPRRWRSAANRCTPSPTSACRV